MQEPDFKILNIDDIVLDIKNPRIAASLEMYGNNITDEAIELALGSSGSSGESTGTSFISLLESIKTNNGVIHPIIVNHDTNLGQLTVIEGNTRVQIYKMLRRDKAKGDWNTIRAMVYTDLAPQYIDAIRLQAHLVGPREWDPYSKAKYLNFLKTTESLSLANIVDFCGGNKSEVNSYITAYKEMEDYYRPLLETDSDFDVTRFSAFREVQKHQIRESIVRHGFTLTDFAQWIIDDKFGPLANVRNLPRVLDVPKAKDAFLKQNMSAALKLVDVQQTQFDLSHAPLEQIAVELNSRILKMEFVDIRQLKSGQRENMKNALYDLLDTLNEFRNDMEGEI